MILPNEKGVPRMLSQQLKWPLQRWFEGIEFGLWHFLEVSSIYLRWKLSFLDLKKIWLIYDLFSEAVVFLNFTFCAFKEYFKNGKWILFNAFVNLKTSVLTLLGSALSYKLLQTFYLAIMPKYNYFSGFCGEKCVIIKKSEISSFFD